MHKKRILIIGEVFVDTHLDIVNGNKTPMTRLGGIFHAARALSALRTDYALAFYSPSYLERDIRRFSEKLNAKASYSIGSIDAAPNVMLIRESTEAGEQCYHNVLKEQAIFRNTESLLDVLKMVKPTDILLFPGRYDAEYVMNALNQTDASLHIDAHYDCATFLEQTKRRIDSLFLSTSSDLFLEKCNRSVAGMIEYFQKYRISCLVLKENRGGATAILVEEQQKYEVPAYPARTIHSVGVGDVFDAVFISDAFGNTCGERLQTASLCAAKYAETMRQQRFEDDVRLIQSKIDAFNQLKGIRLAWDKRSSISIYIAAPDFPDINTKLIDDLCANLTYHNFRPRRPIKENGLINTEMKDFEKYEIYMKDLSLLDECSILIAVLLNHDPGTMVELGMAKKSGKHTILYDPEYLCTNNFLRFTPDRTCHRQSEVIDAVFACAEENNYGL